MNDDPQSALEAGELRRRAEEQKKTHPVAASTAFSAAETERLFHELQVHQIELEMQNEELRKSRTEIEAGLQRYTELYDFAPLSLISLGRNGVICQANLAGAKLLGGERRRLQDVLISRFIAVADLPIFYAFLEAVFTGGTRKSCEVALRREGQPLRFVVMEAVLFPEREECRVAIVDITERKQAAQEIQTQLRELQRWREVTLGREERIQELKCEVNEVLENAGQPLRYKVPQLST